MNIPSKKSSARFHPGDVEVMPNFLKKHTGSRSLSVSEFGTVKELKQFIFRSNSIYSYEA